MAKPKHGRWYNYARHSSSYSLDTRLPSRNPRPHALSSSRRFPSQAVLSALAVIAATPPVVAGSPLPLPTPPAFLCPFIERDNIGPSSNIFLTFPTPTNSPSSSTPSQTQTPSTNHFRHQVIADRYVEGPDNLWRKTSAWTLYGSTCCSDLTTSSTSAQSTSSQTPTPSSMPTSTLNSTSTFDTSALPAGWNSTGTSNSSTDSTIILALAIVLAGCICVFIISCLVWRRRKKRAKDTERKRRLKQSVHPDPSGDVSQKDSRGKMRMWAKSSARWKSNIRQSARRRRKKPIGSTIVGRPLSPTLGDSQISIHAPSAPSRRGSFLAQEPGSSGREVVLCPDGSLSGPTDIQPNSPQPVSPPTYGASFVPRHSPSFPGSLACNPRSISPHPYSAQLSNRPFTEEEPLPYVPQSDGHVATDDKAHLALVRGLASSPPSSLDETDVSLLQPVSAPEWHEMEEEDLGVYLSQVPMTSHNFGIPPCFPLPPKADVPLRYLDDHSIRYGEVDDILVSPISGLPETVFASATAPPIDHPSLKPSAPPLEDDDDDLLFQDWDVASSHILEAPTSAELASARVSVTESSALSTTPQTSFPPTGELTTRNGTLPQYYP